MQLELKPYSACKVLVVDDEPISRMLLTSILEPFVNCISASNGEEAIDQCVMHKPDLILLDMNMPDVDGLTVCRTLKDNADTAQIPVVFVTSTIDVETENMCWEVGASDFVLKPVTASTLVHRIKNHLQGKLRTELLERMTFHDQLTGLYNRLYLSNEIPLLVKQVARDHSSLGVIMMDIDFFKLYNDNYGHLQGDICLQQVAAIIGAHARRPKDAAIRFGGEEFMLVLPYTDMNGVKKVAEDIVAAIRSENITHYAGKDGKLSISAGYAVRPANELQDTGISSLIESADIFLFEAKEAGRNRAIG
ncbi:diguanylate cyclase [uncultured Alteromonas sp.]|jgi:diguanylate cyclase (GGDEF)-like protein|uniref:GGDEF domain-containing response regulator n=1 Tax=uncultured Alteromonas sp. TaxID=179113 RepID=UPI000C587329|nr:diguanylate cyclase response regulator [Rickettsiales bacterium]